MTSSTNQRHIWLHRLGFGVILIVLTIVLGRSLNPFNQLFFNGGHDETQAPRILQFTDNLIHGNIPPRMAPLFSFGFGYPVFNFYAPVAYWITSGFYLIFTEVTTALKLSYLCALCLSFVCTYLFLKKHFATAASLIGACLYVTSIYFAVDIFVRTNLAETWFLLFVPLSLWSLTTNGESQNRWVFILTSIVLSLTLSVHNILSPIWGGLLLIYILLLPQKRKNYLAFMFALLLAASFFIPLLTESKLTYLTYAAGQTDYHDHFLCPIQLWQSAWGYGGSNPGCNADGMSFMLGKPQIILAIFGILIGGWMLIKLRRWPRKGSLWLFFLLVTVGSLLATTYLTEPLWNVFAPVATMIQFPWRFLAFSLIGLSYLSAFFWNSLNIPFKYIVTLLVIAVILKINGKYFTRPLIPTVQFMAEYVSIQHMQTATAYKMPEYLPRTANYAVWQSYNADNQKGKTIPLAWLATNTGYRKSVTIQSPQPVTLNILYFPYWHIWVNNQEIHPTTFDDLGRPVISVSQPGTIKVIYGQSVVEKTGNIISLMTLMGLCLWAILPRQVQAKHPHSHS